MLQKYHQCKRFVRKCRPCNPDLPKDPPCNPVLHTDPPNNQWVQLENHHKCKQPPPYHQHPERKPELQLNFQLYRLQTLWPSPLGV